MYTLSSQGSTLSLCTRYSAPYVSPSRVQLDVQPQSSASDDQGAADENVDHQLFGENSSSSSLCNHDVKYVESLLQEFLHHVKMLSVRLSSRPQVFQYVADEEQWRADIIRRRATPGLACEWFVGPVGCCGNHRVQDLLLCQGSNQALATQYRFSCGHKRSVSLKCMQKNLINPPSRIPPTCPSCFEDGGYHGLEMKGGLGLTLSPLHVADTVAVMEF